MRDKIALFKLGFRDGFRQPVGERFIVAAAITSGVAAAIGLILYGWLG